MFIIKCIQILKNSNSLSQSKKYLMLAEGHRTKKSLQGGKGCNNLWIKTNFCSELLESSIVFQNYLKKATKRRLEHPRSRPTITKVEPNSPSIPYWDLTTMDKLYPNKDNSKTNQLPLPVPIPNLTLPRFTWTTWCRRSNKKEWGK